MGEKESLADVRGQPLSELFARGLAGFARAFADGEGVPPLVVWSAVLCVVPEQGVRVGAVFERARVSRRMTDAVVGTAETAGLVEVDGEGRRGTLRLTPAGRASLAAGRLAADQVEAFLRARIAFVDRVVEAVARPTPQVVIVGAGYDGADRLP